MPERKVRSRSQSDRGKRKVYLVMVFDSYQSPMGGYDRDKTFSTRKKAEARKKKLDDDFIRAHPNWKYPSLAQIEELDVE